MASARMVRDRRPVLRAALLLATLICCAQTACGSSSRGLRQWHVVSTPVQTPTTPTTVPTPMPQPQLADATTITPVPVDVTVALPSPSPVVLPSPDPSPVASPQLPSPVPSPDLPSPDPSPELPSPVPSPQLPSPDPSPQLPSPVPSPQLPSPVASPRLPSPVASPRLPSPVTVPAPVPVPSPAYTGNQFPLPVITDVFYNDDNIHFGSLIRISDWVDRAWGVTTMSAGSRLQYDKYIQLPYVTWRFIRDPMDQSNGPNNTIMMGTSVVHVVSRDGSLVWYCNSDGYVTLMDYATALRGDLSLIRARMMDKHNLKYQYNAPLPLGYHWVKLRFDAVGGSEVTPSDSGLAWKPQSDASYLANRGAWEYGFSVEDVDWTDPTILRKRKV